jgi:DNA-binding transcriptional LysR family regulator
MQILSRLPSAATTISSAAPSPPDGGSLGLKYALENRGSGYFPRRLVAPYLADKRLKLIADAPVFSYPAYAVYPADGSLDSLDLILTNMRHVAARQAVSGSGSDRTARRPSQR